jgi:PIN domain nuclease of toxin-antitoxin system
VKLLLDTHCFLWLQISPERFSDDHLALLQAGENRLFLSAASAWEITVKHALGKLHLPAPPAIYLPTRMSTAGVEGLPVHIAHATRVGDLPSHHRDPFDRLLVAQAQVDNLTLVTADAQLDAYDVDMMRV